METSGTTEAPRTNRRNKGVRYELYLPVEMDADLKAMKDKTGNSVASYIRNAVRAALDQDKAA